MPNELDARVIGVSRMADNERAVLVSFDRPLTDDELRQFHDRLRAALPEREGLAEDGDPTDDPRWNAGVNYAIERLCSMLGVDPKSISWDAATETLDGDVNSVLGNVLRAAYGEEWSSNARDTIRIRSALSAPAERGVEEPSSPTARQAEPAGWRYRYNRMGSGQPWHFSSSDPGDLQDGYVKEPLYTVPPPPAGMVMVPREPTDAMLEAVWWNGPDVEAIARQRSKNIRAKMIYRAMIAAAPGQPAQGDGT